MSQDLFAAFNLSGSNHQNNNPDQSPVHDRWPTSVGVAGSTKPPPENIHENSPVATSSEFDDDDFGDFENASPSRPWEDKTNLNMSPVAAKNVSPLPPKPNPATSSSESRIGKHPFAANMDLLFSADGDEYDAGLDDLDDLSRNPAAAMAYSKRIIEEQLDKQSRGEPRLTSKFDPSSLGNPKIPEVGRRNSRDRPPKDPNVLFDADDVSDESEVDDFGDFEDAPQPSKPVPGHTRATNVHTGPTALDVDLLGLGLSDGPAPSQPRASFISNKSRQPSRVISAGKSRESQKIPDRSARDTVNQEEAWDDFEETDPTSGSPMNHAVLPTVIAATSNPRTETRRRGPEDASPPTNVPPPVILLSTFSPIFSTGREVLFDPLSKLELAGRQQLLAHPATVQFLRSYLKSAIVLGHIVAGRKLRWKRDQRLAQSMRIGPAAAGGKGGMKLAGVDKSEAAKEDREVLDAIRLWKSQLGKLRGALTTAGSSKNAGAKNLPPIPEIADTMPIKTLKAVEGGFTAPHACALCGLKREERVAKIDVDVNDSFGEWWLERTSMHLICHDFWVEHKDKLKSH